METQILTSKTQGRSLPLVIWPLALCVGVLAWWCYTGYIPFDLTFGAGLMLFPMVCIVKRPDDLGHWRFAVLTLASMGLALALPSRTLHFFSLAFVALFVLESRLGKLSFLPIFLVVLMTALIKNWVVLFGFPVRLSLSSLSAKALSMFGFMAHAAGNIIVLNGQEYSVDPACMGLSMVQVSLLFAVAVLAVLERKLQKTLGIGWVLVFLTLICGLNIFYNLLRITLLVLMDWMPGTVMHEIGGLVGLGIYVFLPTWFLAVLFYRFFGKKDNFTQRASASFRLKPVFSTVLATAFSIALIWMATKETRRTLEQPQTDYAELSIPLPNGDFTKKILAHGVVQYANDDVLIYVKPIRGFYSSEHTPLACWEGSGYTFVETDEALLNNGHTYYKGLLKHKDSTLYTAWWYSNGMTQTTSQLQWRWLDLSGAPGFFLVNITAESESKLLEVLMKMR